MASGAWVRFAPRLRRRRRMSRFRSGQPRAVHRKASEATMTVEDVPDLNRSTRGKALAVNRRGDFFGSFAEIGAGQEVSRTFLTAGGASNTVARTISAYDMAMSNAFYGEVDRYVTEKRLNQMLIKEYDLVLDTSQSDRSADCRYFSYATTAAAKALGTDRECECWIGLRFQAKVGAEPSTVSLHARMSDATAELQGQAIGLLGVNLIYLLSRTTNPYFVTRFLLDGIEPGRLEVDCLHFTGPEWEREDNTVDARILAMRMVQSRVAPAVYLEWCPKAKSYVQMDPNSAFYRRPMVVQKSRFQPPTYMHNEVLWSAYRQMQDEAGPGAREPLKVLDLQLDDIVAPWDILDTGKTLNRLKEWSKIDSEQDGLVTLEEIKHHILRGNADPELEEKVEQEFEEIDITGSGKIAIDEVCGITRDSQVVKYFLDRFQMVEALGFPIMVSSFKHLHQLGDYLSRYTSEQVSLAVGGGTYMIERGVFKEDKYTDCQGGMLEAFGRLFRRRVRILEFPNINRDGILTPATKDVPLGSAASLHKYLCEIKKIGAVGEEYLAEEVSNTETNEPYRKGSLEVVVLVRRKNDSWRTYVEPGVAAVIDERKVFDGKARRTNPADALHNMCDMMTR
eukprot:CAMPEP_0178410324 /NCGR_PEP_ID=MMETSP0689_2-20121128/20920_1 /TAXON_ID=160604 /ORGANISM="Amphidinium massartii, Strain CS-259" /LENGTH=621 /DNA_ID=CAMNT_0020031495 /DNA_START=116 /DNA_END=1978 /DNA_ORIENTATION=-